MFKVSYFRVGKKYKFNILNFTRSMEKFYREKMNIVTRAEKINGKNRPASGKGSQSGSDEYGDDWRYNTCENIQFENSEIIKSQNSVWKNNKEITTYTYYQKLTFQYTFTEEDANSAVYFAYARPYGYTDLKKDLKEAKDLLMEKKLDNGMLPELRILDKKDYVDYHKFKNLHESNEEHVPLSPVLPGCADGGLDEANPNNTKARKVLQKKKISQRPTCREDEAKTKVT